MRLASGGIPMDKKSEKQAKPKGLRSPINLLFGECLHMRRLQIGLSGDQVVASALHVTSSHLRLIEAGWNPCPVGAAYPLAQLMRWPFPKLAELLTAISHAYRSSEGRYIDIPHVRDRFDELAHQPTGLQKIWMWCRDQLPEDVVGFDTDFSQVADGLPANAPLNDLMRFLEPPRSLEHVEVFSKKESDQPSGTAPIPPFFHTIVHQLEGALVAAEYMLRHALPILPEEGAFNLIHAAYKKEIRSCEAYLGYTPDVSVWENSTLDLSFLGNRYDPTPDQDCKILLYVKIDGNADMKGLETSINNVLQKKYKLPVSKGEDKNKLKKKLISIRPRKDAPLHFFIFNLLTRKVRLAEGKSAHRSADEVQLNNAWFFDAGPHGLICTLDTYDFPVESGRSAFYSISIDPIDAIDLKEDLRKIAAGKKP
jgi:hypothetical protein